MPIQWVLIQDFPFRSLALILRNFTPLIKGPERHVHLDLGVLIFYDFFFSGSGEMFAAASTCSLPNF